jgi:phage shock protein C
VKRLVRSSKDRMFAGICGGLGEYFSIDSTFIRLVTVVLGICSVGSILLAYLIGMLIIPLESVEVE